VFFTASEAWASPPPSTVSLSISSGPYSKV
jgi:hypothetical protein